MLGAASAWGRSLYWSALGVTQLLGWAMLALACALAPHTWQERKRAGASIARSWAYAWSYGGARRRLRLRRKLLGAPAGGLADVPGALAVPGLWAMAVLVVGGFVAVLIRNPPREAWIVWSYLGGLFMLLLYLWAASQACRFFVEARRSGLLELLLVTPLSDRQIVRGQWQALLRMFGLPVALLLGVHVAGATLSQLGFQRIATQVSTVTTSTVTNRSGTVTTQSTVVGTRVTLPVKAGTNTPPAAPVLRAPQPRRAGGHGRGGGGGDGAEHGCQPAGPVLVWHVDGYDLQERQPGYVEDNPLCASHTLVCVRLWDRHGHGNPDAAVRCPLRARGQSASWFAWWPLLSAVLPASLAIAKDVGFIIWSRKKLHSSLRAQAACGFGQPRFVPPPPAPAATPTPPIIPASG